MTDTDHRDHAELDPDEVALMAFKVWSYKQGEVVSLMVHLGDRLGLYRALDGIGPVTADEFAERTGFHPRWLLEWCRNQAAAGLLDSADGHHFELTAVGAAVLSREEDSLAFAAGAFGAPPPPDVVEGLADAFETGIGLSYDQLGSSHAHRTERMLGPWARLQLVPRILPALDGVVDKLTAGAVVVDVGCGAGLALTAMARAFPASTFHGYDPSHNAIHLARQRVADLGLHNVALHALGGEDLPSEPTFDFVLTFDCLHDMTHPREVMAAVRRAIHPDGTWLIKDIRSTGDFASDRRNPMLAMLYGFSVSSCLSSAMSHPEGAGLGTLGLPPDRAEAWTTEAGFSRFVRHDFDDPANLYYEVRP
ncbi:MAG TPA: class I SAM-dependent methyltransferase [Acidimicrobiales bacterium]|nr:class I SAM-dependent methyltransferase [Acidimicrobiales bacterium]